MSHSSFPLAEFNETLTKNPYWSSYTCFAETIKDRKNLHPRTIRRFFDKLVDKSDYAKSGKYYVVKFLIERSKGIK